MLYAVLRESPYGDHQARAVLSKRVGHLTTNAAPSPLFEVRLLMDCPPGICIVPCEFARVRSFRAKRGGGPARVPRAVAKGYLPPDSRHALGVLV